MFIFKLNMTLYVSLYVYMYCYYEFLDILNKYQKKYALRMYVPVWLEYWSKGQLHYRRDCAEAILGQGPAEQLQRRAKLRRARWRSRLALEWRRL